MAGAADWVAEQRRLKEEAAAAARASIQAEKDRVKSITFTERAIRKLDAEAERAAKALARAEAAETLKTSNALKSAVTGAVGGAVGVLASRGLASQASPNGLASVDKAASILSGTIGTLLLPGFVALGAVALVAADSIQGWIDKNLDTIIDDWADAIIKATNAMRSLKEWLTGDQKKWGIAGPLAGFHPGFGAGGGGGAGAQAPMLNGPWGNAGLGGNLQPGIAKGGGWEPPGGAWGGLKNFNPNAKEVGGPQAAADPLLLEVAKNMRMIGNDMQLAMGPGSHMADPVGMWKQIAQQISNSELEAKRMEMQQKAINLVQRIADNLERRALGGQAGGAVIGGRVRRPGAP